MSRGGARAAVTSTVVASLVLLSAMAFGSGVSPARRALGWWATGLLTVVTLVLLAGPRSRRAEVDVDADERSAMAQPSAAIPPPQAVAFQNRQVLEDLVADFGPGRRGGVAVLQGLAGVGKTQVAAEYARRVWESTDVLVWVDASSRDSILQRLSKAAVATLAADDHDVQQAAHRMLDWLNGSHQRWLVVLDDLRDPRDLDGLWPPRTPYGQIVITTCLRDDALAVNGAHVGYVESFTSPEAVAFLTERLARRPAQWEGAAELAEAMGNHPRALAQAAAYIAFHRELTCATYLAMLDGQRRVLSGPYVDELPRDHRDAIAATWTLSIKRANQIAPHRLARPLMMLSAYMDAHGVPEDVFTSAAALGYLRRTARHAVNEKDVRDTLSCLHAFSLLTYEPRDRTHAIRLHALSQRVVHDSMTQRERTRAVRATTDALSQVWPRVERDRDMGAVLRSNALALRDVAGIRVWDARFRALLFRVGHSLGESGQAAAARDSFQVFVDAMYGTFSPRGHLTLQARVSLAHWQGEAGDPDAAAAALRQVIENAPQRFWFQRELKLKAHRALARWLAEAGNPEGALAEADAVIGDFCDVFGRRHRETLYLRNVQARCLAAVGCLDLAIHKMVGLVEDFTRHGGRRDPDTLCARNNLADTYHVAGDYPAACVEYTKLLPDLYEVFGTNHPKILCSRNNLARCLIDADDPTVSVSDLRRQVDDCDRVLGPSHPETLVAWNNLARSFTKACG